MTAFHSSIIGFTPAGETITQRVVKVCLLTVECGGCLIQLFWLERCRDCTVFSNFAIHTTQMTMLLVSVALIPLHLSCFVYLGLCCSYHHYIITMHLNQ